MTVYIYADVVVLISILATVPMLWGVARAYSLKFVFRRAVAAAVLGGIATVLAVLLQQGYIFMIFAAILSFIAITYISFGKLKLRLLLKAAAMLFAESVLLGGFCVLVENITGDSTKSFISLGCFIVGVVLLVLSLRSRKTTMLSGREAARSLSCEVLVCLNGESALLSAMLDTGNTLTEPLSQCPVMLINAECAKNKFGINNIMCNDLKNKRSVPYRTPESDGVMVCIKADRVRIKYDGKWHDAGDVYIGVSGKLKCEALVGLHMLSV